MSKMLSRVLKKIKARLSHIRVHVIGLRRRAYASRLGSFLHLSSVRYRRTVESPPLLFGTMSTREVGSLNYDLSVRQPTQEDRTMPTRFPSPTEILDVANSQNLSSLARQRHSVGPIFLGFLIGLLLGIVFFFSFLAGFFGYGETYIVGNSMISRLKLIPAIQVAYQKRLQRNPQWAYAINCLLRVAAGCLLAYGFVANRRLNGVLVWVL